MTLAPTLAPPLAVTLYNIIAVLDFVDHFVQNLRWCLANFVTREPVTAMTIDMTYELKISSVN